MISILMLVRIEHDVLRDMTRKAIRSILSNTQGDCPQIIVVRNGGEELGISRDEFGPKISIMDLIEHRPLGIAYNKAFSLSHGDPICVMHNDVELPFDWNIPLERVARGRAIAFPMVDEEKSFCERRGIPKTQPWQTTGACFMLSRELWFELGGYDENFIGYHWEDTDLFYRAHKAGARLVRCPVTIIHHRGATRTFTKNEDGKYFEKNMEYHDKKHGGKFVPQISENPQEV